MKFTLNWLKDHLDTNASGQQIAETLTAIGLEVESVDDPAARLKDFIVAEILEAAPHPNAQKLQVCKVNDGKETRQIVCGAANARSGLKVVLAREGVFIPGGGFTIKKTAIRGVESNGMLCSAEELGLSDASDGIIELPATAQPGAPVAAALGADDPVIDIAVTPNRADALGVRGIARDLAAAGVGTLKPLTIPKISSQILSPIRFALETLETCPYIIGYYFQGVHNGDSPDWLKQRLIAIGQKPISCLVDITNYFTHGFARPLHVFDADKISGNLVVRQAREGERITALNDKEYTLSPGMTVLADDKGVQALGGIIGGRDSAVTEQTKNVLLEVALFDPVNIAQTGRKLDILSDARYRFERGVDSGFMHDGAQLAAHMIMQLCGGKISQLIGAGRWLEEDRYIDFSPSTVHKLGGVDISPTRCTAILQALGCIVENITGGALRVSIPFFRRDIEGKADLVEEILRIHGYQYIPSTPLPVAYTQTLTNPAYQRAALAKQVLSNRGITEVVSWSFIPQAQALQFGGGKDALRLQNPISAELDAMRPSLLPNLLTAARDNAYRGVNAMQLFEVGPQFADPTPAGHITAATGLRTGNVETANYEANNFRRFPRSVDAFDTKADGLALLSALGVKSESLAITATAPAWYHPGRSGAFTLGKTVLGYFGELHPAVVKQWDLTTASGFEIFLEAIPQPRAKGKAKPPLKLSDFQAVTRDFAFTVDANISAGDIVKTLQKADPLITSVQLFDVYAGKGVEPGKKSVAISITLQAADRTLSEGEINTSAQAIVAAATKGFGGQLRQ